MLNKFIVFATSTIAIGVLAGCTMSAEQKEAYEQEKARMEADIAAHQGESVDRVCPRRSDGWRSYSYDSLLLEARDQWYRLELVGTCDPEGAFAGIATRSAAGSSCISRGDDLLTSRPRDRERCVITGIYKWNEGDAGEDDAAEETSDTSGADPAS